MSEERKKMLSCWHKLEHFTPSNLPKSNTIIKMDPNGLPPWNTLSLQLEKDQVVIYTIYLGVFNDSTAIDFAYTFFKEENHEQNQKDNKILFASIKVNHEGKYIQDTLGVSMLPWAMGQLEKKKVTSDSWNTDFQDMLKNLKLSLDPICYEIIEEGEEEGEIKRQPKTLSLDDLYAIQSLIENHCEWSVSPETSFYFQQKKRKMRAIEKRSGKLKEPIDILNSFYIKDLEKIIGSSNKIDSNSAFNSYMKGHLKEPIDRVNLGKHIEEIKKMLQPSKFPEGCWPSSYALNLMQQFAVNIIVGKANNSNSEKLFSVNGPPGTGKTTLLRHAIAGILVKRAKILATYKDPEDAFTKTKDFKGEWKTFPLYQPDEQITKGGIIIASSNNGAVENITKELPLEKEVKPYENEITYFKDAVLQGEEKSWGVLSATLGNMKNRRQCKSDLWYYFNDNKQKTATGLQIYFKNNGVKDLETWKTVVSKFNAKQSEVISEKERLQLIGDNAHKIDQIKKAFQYSESEIKLQKNKINTLKREIDSNKVKSEELKEEREHILSEIQLIKSSKPNAFSYWLNSKIRNTYEENISSLFRQMTDNQKAFENLQIINSALEKELETRSITHEKFKQEHLELTKELERIKTAKEELDTNFADKDYWDAIETKRTQNSCPWYSEKLQKLQTELFIIALELQETFLLTANRKDNRITKTLDAYFEFITGSSKVSEDTAMTMWNIFLMVVPVVSTTFASFDMMFSNVSAEKLPWLFIDEAGQAVPQAAAGGIWRSEKVIVVGDPLQIEPVDTIPRIITEKLRDHFDLSSNQVGSEHSVQTGADGANKYGTYLNNSSGEDIWIGAPLRIHRRCLDPMFSIANSIAYNNSMFLATSPPEHINIGFETQFIHCQGQVSNRHYCEEQAIIVKEIIQQEISRNRQLPKTFVISPFKEVSDSLKTYLQRNLSYSSGIMSPKQDKFLLNSWIGKNIGTVHTFQGKQSEGVIMCLGLDERTKGAASWASSKPNILNVALTRAKYRFIAIGDEDIWLKQPFFKELEKLRNKKIMNR